MKNSLFNNNAHKLICRFQELREMKIFNKPSYADRLVADFEKEDAKVIDLALDLYTKKTNEQKIEVYHYDQKTTASVGENSLLSFAVCSLNETNFTRVINTIIKKCPEKYHSPQGKMRHDILFLKYAFVYQGDTGLMAVEKLFDNEVMKAALLKEDSFGWNCNQYAACYLSDFGFGILFKNLAPKDASLTPENIYSIRFDIICSIFQRKLHQRHLISPFFAIGMRVNSKTINRLIKDLYEKDPNLFKEAVTAQDMALNLKFESIELATTPLDSFAKFPEKSVLKNVIKYILKLENGSSVLLSLIAKRTNSLTFEAICLVPEFISVLKALNKEEFELQKNTIIKALDSAVNKEFSIYLMKNDKNADVSKCIDYIKLTTGQERLELINFTLNHVKNLPNKFIEQLKQLQRTYQQINLALANKDGENSDYKSLAISQNL
jgi:hypothetical protein